MLALGLPMAWLMGTVEYMERAHLLLCPEGGVEGGGLVGPWWVTSTSVPGRVAGWGNWVLNLRWEEW